MTTRSKALPMQRVLSKSINIVDVARQAGVSVGTVSNVVNHPELVSEKMRLRVQQVIDQLSYRPNVLAKSLREQRTMTIGLVLSDITTPFASSLARTVEASASEVGMSVVFADTNENIARSEKSIDTFDKNAVEGIILAPSPGDHDFLQTYLARGWPIVAVNRRPANAVVPSVLTDHFGGAVAATDHLIEHGHQRIGVVSRSPEISSIQDRLRGYHEALERHGLAYDPNLVVFEQASLDGGVDAVGKLFAAVPRPTALLSFSTIMTLGCVMGLRQHKLRVPNDVAFIGFDDAVWGAAMSPAITSVALRAERVGEEATRLLLEWISSRQPPAQYEHTIATHLIVRESCGCPPLAESPT